MFTGPGVAPPGYGNFAPNPPDRHATPPTRSPNAPPLSPPASSPSPALPTRPYGSCPDWPRCLCFKARWVQACAGCGMELAPGCCAKKFGTGWGHMFCVAARQQAPTLADPDEHLLCVVCRMRSSRRSNGLCDLCTPAASVPPSGGTATTADPPRPTLRWGSPGVIAVWDPAYSPPGIYLSFPVLMAKVKPGRTVPPAREDAESAQIFDRTDDALEAFFQRNPRRQKVEVWR